MCIYIYIYICMYTYICIYICVYIYMFVYVFVFVFTCCFRVSLGMLRFVWSLPRKGLLQERLGICTLELVGIMLKEFGPWPKLSEVLSLEGAPHAP